MEISFEGDLLDVREFKKKDGTPGTSAVVYARGERSETIEAQLNGVDKNTVRAFIKKPVRVKAELRVYQFGGNTRVAYTLKSIEERKGA